MLQMYYASLYLKVNGEIAGKLLGGVVKLRDDGDDLVELVLDNVSWKELYDEIIDGKASHYMYVGNTFWKKRPYISASGFCSEDLPKYFEGDTSKFTIAWVYKLDKHYTVNSVLKHAKADQAVQWFKERGLSVCPLQ